MAASVMAGHLRRLSGPHVEGGVLSGVDILAPRINQAVIIIGVTRALSVAGAYLRQPRVIFEVIGGILLGPSALGRNQDYLSRIFPATSLAYIGLVADFGLVLYLFLIGLEMDPQMLVSHAKRAGAVALCGMIVPFCLGIAVARPMFDTLMAGDPEFAGVSFVAFFVFIGTALSITAFPVLARILRETGLLYTRSGSLAMGAAALNDAVAWCLLILAISIANAGDLAVAGYVFLSVVCFALGLFFLVAPLLRSLVAHVEALPDQQAIEGHLFALTLVLVFLSAWTTALLGVHSIFGAFLFGLIVPRDSRLFVQCEEKMTVFVMTILLPLYFALSGLKTDVTEIRTGEEGSMVVLVCVVATAGKLIGAGLPALASGLPFREASVVAFLMNTRGLVELIVLNLGVQSGVLNRKVFTVMVLMCLFTTFLTCPVVYFIYPPHLRVDAEPKEGDASEEQASEEGERALSPHGLRALRLAVVVDRAEQLPSLLALLFALAPRCDAQQQSLRVHAVRLVEPTKSDRDRVLLAWDNGRVLDVRRELLSPKEHPHGEGSELLPLSLFCAAVGASVAVSRVAGDVKEFPAELRRLADEEAADLLLLPWRSSQYSERLLWGASFRLAVPLGLVLDCRASDPQLEPRPLRAVVALVTFAATDVTLLQLARRLLDAGLAVTVVVPAEEEQRCPPAVLALLEELQTCALTHPQLVVLRCSFGCDSVDGFFFECSASAYDLVLLSFADASTTPGVSPHVSVPIADAAVDRSNIKQRSRAGTLSAMVQALVSPSPDIASFRRTIGVPESALNSGASYPELGPLAERIYRASNLASCILLLHPPRTNTLLRHPTLGGDEGALTDARRESEPRAVSLSHEGRIPGDEEGKDVV